MQTALYPDCDSSERESALGDWFRTLILYLLWKTGLVHRVKTMKIIPQGPSKFQFLNLEPSSFHVKCSTDRATVAPDWLKRRHNYLFLSQAVEIIEDHDPNTPLFLMVAYTATHSPIEYDPEYLTNTNCSTVNNTYGRGDHCAMGAQLDHGKHFKFKSFVIYLGIGVPA